MFSPLKLVCWTASASSLLQREMDRLVKAFAHGHALPGSLHTCSSGWRGGVVECDGESRGQQDLQGKGSVVCCWESQAARHGAPRRGLGAARVSHAASRAHSADASQMPAGGRWGCISLWLRSLAESVNSWPPRPRPARTRETWTGSSNRGAT